MQLTNILALFALTAVAAAAPQKVTVPKVTPPKVAPPPKPVVGGNTGTISNTCQSGPAYCCSPTGATNTGDKNGDTKAGTTCVAGATTCSSITICCNNLQQGTAPSTQNCGLAGFLAQPVVFKVQE